MKTLVSSALFFLLSASMALAQSGWVQMQSGTTAGLYHLSLVGRDTLYASGETLIRSTNGGLSWDSLANVPSQQWAQVEDARLQFVDAHHGFLCISSDTVYSTSDGGDSWIAGGATGFAQGPATTMFFSTRDRGCLMGGSRIAYTTDGARTWHPATGFSGGDYKCMAFYDHLHGYAMGGVEAWHNGKPDAPTFERTTDGGVTWTPIYPGYNDGNPGLQSTILTIAPVSPDSIFALGDRVLALSVDSGLPWKVHADTVANQVGIYAVTFSSSRDGYAVGTKGTIIRSTDGGQSWMRQASGLGLGDYLLAVVFKDSMNGYASGTGGIVLKTTNGGVSWVDISPSAVISLNSINYPQPARDRTTLEYTLPASQHVTIDLIGVTGSREAQPLTHSFQNEGTQTVSIDTSALAAGTYTYVIRSERYLGSGRIQVVH